MAVQRMIGVWHCGPDAIGTIKAGILVYARPVGGRSWEVMPEAMVVAWFRKCCISNGLDGIKDADLFECASEKEDLNTVFGYG